MRRTLANIAVALTLLLGGCGGTTSASSAALPAFIPPLMPSGIVAPTGALTMIGGGTRIGSTILPAAAAAIFTINSGTTPQPIAVGGALATYAIQLNDTAGATATIVPAATGRRPASSAQHRVAGLDRELRIPDRLSDRAERAQWPAIGARIAARRAAAAVRSVTTSSLGAQRTFKLQGGTIDGTQMTAAVLTAPATLVAQSAHADVWLDSAIVADAGILQREYPSGSADFATVAAAFEHALSVETQAFGPAYTTGLVNFENCASDGTPLRTQPPQPDTTGVTDPHINVLITDRLAGSGEGGYFFGLDMLDQTEANCVPSPQKPVVNGVPLLVIAGDAYTPYGGAAADTYPANNESYWLHGDMPQTLAHELQHYLHFVNKYLQQHVDHPNDPQAGTLDDSFIDEGCSVLAQDLVAGAAVGDRESPLFVRAFLLAPGNFSLTSFAGYAPDAVTATANGGYGYYRNTAGNYGFAYLFIRYLYDRFGPDALKAIYAETNFGGSVRPDTGPATAAAHGESFVPLFREFTTAIAVHSGGAVPPFSSDPAYRFDPSIILRGSVQTYSRRLPPYERRTIVQPGPLNPVATGSASDAFGIATGQRQIVELLDGGALFITPVRPWSQGATLSAGGNIGGGGSLAQGPLPMPSPAYF